LRDLRPVSVLDRVRHHHEDGNPIRRGPFTIERMIASLRTPVSGSLVIVIPEPR
jgi:hypothetical protein